MKHLLISLLLVVGANASAAGGGGVDYCARYMENSTTAFLMQSLAQKLMYSYEEFCNHPRIMDVYQEDKLVYKRETDEYQKYKFVTVHYNEYSCEYQYNLDEKRWAKQECYNTF